MHDLILYILAIMIFWDFSNHVIELFGWHGKFLNSQNKLTYYYPHLTWKKTPIGAVQRQNKGILYQRFWVIYWGVAFLLSLILIFWF